MPGQLPLKWGGQFVVKRGGQLGAKYTQTDLDQWIETNNTERTHTGKYCYGKTPMQTFLDSLELAQSKMLDTLAQS